MKKLTKEQINLKVQQINPNIYIDWNKSGNYVSSKQKVIAVDPEFGAWSISIDKLLMGRNHPKHKTNSLKYTQSEIDDIVKNIHNNIVVIDWIKTPYIKQLKQKVLAVDKDFGSWTLKLGDLLKGTKHRQRYYKNKQITKEEIDQRIQEKFNGEISIDWNMTPVFNTKTKVTAIDKNYGSWQVNLSKLLLGARYPERSRRMNKKSNNNYLTEQKLSEILGKYYKIISNKFLIINNEKIKPDIYIPSKRLIIEFDGHFHYTKSSNQKLDKKKKLFCIKNNLKIIRIPYFIQICPELCLLLEIPIMEQVYPHGFINEKIVLPIDYNEEGLKLFIENLETYSFAKQDIINSISNIGLDLDEKLPKSLHFLIKNND